MTALLLPIRGFDGKTRLAETVGAGERRSLLLAMARRAVDAGLDAGLDVIVVSPADEVRDWARSAQASAIEDADEGLDDACRGATEVLGGRSWIVAHADLPLITPAALRQVAVAATAGVVLVPSRDGGTSVIANRGPFSFSYGPGSFHRHLSTVPDATVLAIPELSIDLDGVLELGALSALGQRPTLAV